MEKPKAPELMEEIEFIWRGGNILDAKTARIAHKHARIMLNYIEQLEEFVEQVQP